MGTQQAGPGPRYDAAAFAAALAVPAQNAAANVDAVDVVGNKTDTVAGTSIVSLARQAVALGPVPAQNAAANVSMRDVIGNKTDDEAGNSIYAHHYIIGQHIHSACLVYPTLAGSITVVAGVGAWTLGAAMTAVVPINTIQNPFDIHGIQIEALSANSLYELWMYYGVANTFAGMARFSRTAIGNAVRYHTFQTVIIPANSQIDCRLASAGGAPESVSFSIAYHVY